MKRPGLTEAMRAALENAQRGYHDLIKRATWIRIRQDGLVDRSAKLTPRGQAALAAPRVTAAELAMLERIEKFGDPWHELRGAQMRLYRVYNALRLRGFVDPIIHDCKTWLTPAGTTALNNIRAASGSSEWKPQC